MKLLKATALSLLAATPSFAGGLAEPMMEPEVIEEETAAGSRAGILVPIMAVILIGLAMSGGGGDDVVENGLAE
jgi:hypothetical protein